MRSIILVLIYLGTFAFLFFVFSLFGLLWVESYWTIISEGGWFGFYAVFIGSWLAALPTIEYYNHNEAYFKRAWN
jgi:hypothetical protein